MRVLFRKDGKPYSQKFIHKCVQGVGGGCRPAIEKAISNSRHGINRKIFAENAARLLPVMRLTQRGPFRGVKFAKGAVLDPENRIARCWELIGEDVCRIRRLLDHASNDRSRVMGLLEPALCDEIAGFLWVLFKRLLPICMTPNTMGMPAASKILFCGLPEAAISIEEQQWRELYQTVDYQDVIKSMVAEIGQWEAGTGLHLNRCDASVHATLPSVYGIMAMRSCS
ncbi:MAG TPA: hypothetical protein ACFCUC_07100 [Desulfobacterales bacterium]